MITATRPTPLGTLTVSMDPDGAVRAVTFGDRAIDGTLDSRQGEEFFRQIEEYADGRRAVFTLPLRFVASAFQQQVWKELLKIPYGETRTYGQLAQAIGRPGLARAVGRANATNPIPILIPCHRVIGSDGTLVGYEGGLTLKARLLDLERNALAALPS